MKILNTDGINGPNLIKMFSCEKCKFLGKATVELGGLPYKCYHDEIVKNYRSAFQLFSGDIGYDKITPDYCPFLFNRKRIEKIKKLNNEA